MRMNVIKRYFSGMSRRTLVLTLALVLSLVTASGSTLAWLVDRTNPVRNTFTYGDVHVDVEESPSQDGDDGDEDPDTNTYKMVPGKEIAKDPHVIVAKGSEDCFVYVKVEKSDNFDDFMTCQIAEGWLPLEGETDVYYREVSAADVAAADLTFPILKGDKVKVLDTVTVEMLRALNMTATPAYPTLTFWGYAVQRDDAIEEIKTPLAAWLTLQTQYPDLAAADILP